MNETQKLLIKFLEAAGDAPVICLYRSDNHCAALEGEPFCAPHTPVPDGAGCFNEGVAKARREYQAADQVTTQMSS